MASVQSPSPKQKRRLHPGKANVPLYTTEGFRSDLDSAALESDGMSRNEYMHKVLEMAVAQGWRFKRGALTLLNGENGLAPLPTLRDIKEVAFYEDSSVEAGMTSGTFADNPPSRIEVPASWKLPVDFVVKVHGDSMRGVIEDGDLAAFVKSNRAINGQVVAALKDGQILIKLYNDNGDGKPELCSVNSEYPPIPCCEGILIQGVFQGPFPSPKKQGRH